MHQAVVTKICRPCGRTFSAQTGTFELDARTPVQSREELGPQNEQPEKPLRLALNDWDVFSVATSVLAPQQAEGSVCTWLQNVAGSMNLCGGKNAQIEKPLYGKIVYDQLGELCDFDITRLSYEMLDRGFDNWMNALSSGELLIDIVNKLIDYCIRQQDKLNEEPEKSIFKVIERKMINKVKLIEVSPNKLAPCRLLFNHNQLVDKFLDPILASMRDMGMPPPGLKPGTAGNIRQALHCVRPVGHHLMRNRYATREWTWKALMLLVLILMALCGSLTGEQEKLFCCLTGEFDVSQLVVPELQQALKDILNGNKVTVPKQPAVHELRWALPYKRVLKHGPIEFNSILFKEFVSE